MKIKTYIFGILIVLAFLFLLGCSEENTDSNTLPSNSIVSTNDESIKIPLDQVTNQLKKFDYDANGVSVTYFAVRGSDGEIRTAFDACDVCGGSKGYAQQGNDIKCNNCGRVFSIDGLGTKNKGYGCWPSFLSHEIKDGNVIIKMSELEQGAFRFA